MSYIEEKVGVSQVRNKAQRWKGLKRARSPSNENVFVKNKIYVLIMS